MLNYEFILINTKRDSFITDLQIRHLVEQYRKAVQNGQEMKAVRTMKMLTTVQMVIKDQGNILKVDEFLPEYWQTAK